VAIDTAPCTVAGVVTVLERCFPPAWAEQWDRVELVLGEPGAPVRLVLCVVDCVPQTVAEARELGADLMVAHHPLLLQPVSSVAPTTYKGRILHDLIRHGVALYTAHTNADVADPGVSDALAARLGLTRPAPAAAGGRTDRRGVGRRRQRGRCCRGHRRGRCCAGDAYLADATAAGVDAYLTADLRHHPVSEHLAGGGPAVLDAGHWATERPWLDDLARLLYDTLPVEAVASNLDTDPWTVHADGPTKEL
jgi:putative NIF3 family GTP cyclohydrolase 1 type 2